MSTIPAAADALVDVCRAALPDAEVTDGPPTDLYQRGADGFATSACVCWDADGPAVDADLDREQSDGMGSDLETYRIYSSLFKFHGEMTTRALRVSAFADYAAVKAELRSRRPLAPGVMRARMVTVDYEVRPVEGGWEGRLRWAVEVEAFDRD